MMLSVVAAGLLLVVVVLLILRPLLAPDDAERPRGPQDTQPPPRNVADDPLEVAIAQRRARMAERDEGRR
jgi:hypothetical protein